MKSYGYRIMDLHRVNDFLASSVCYTRLQKQIIFYIMIDKKKLIEELLDCVADATDTETQITSLIMAGMLVNEVLEEALTIPVVVSSLPS